jgi:hypothetical protein
MRPTPLLALLLFACRPSASEPPREPAAATPASPPAAALALPRPGARAPDFSLRATDGTTVRLAEALASGPVVLVFGSFT